jgi:hypothetical protein
MVKEIANQQKIELNVPPTLIIMEGSTAGKIGYRVKKMIQNQYGEIPIVRFLWVDTDVNIPEGAENWFSADERAELVGYDANSVLRNIEKFPTIKEWWPSNANVQAGMVSRGAAQQMRLIGRLSLFRKFNESVSGSSFLSKLQYAVESIHHIENITKTRKKSNEEITYNVSDDNTRVIFIFSTCGGTGSSLSFDLAYLCRRFLRGNHPELLAFSILPPVIDQEIKDESTLQRRKIRANTYAWFMEDQYLMDHPNWYVEYPGIAPVDVSHVPFDVHFVVDMLNEANNRLDSSEDIYKMLAQAIFLDTGTAIAGENSSFMTNVGVLDNYIFGRKQAYSSLASASIVFPAERLKDYCGNRFAFEILQKELFSEVDSDWVKTMASSAIADFGLADESLVRSLQAHRPMELLKKSAILKSDSLRNAVTLLTNQFQEANIFIDNEANLISDRQIDVLEGFKQRIEGLITSVFLSRGIKNAKALIEVFRSPIHADESDLITSLADLQHRIAHLGVSEAKLSNLRQSYEESIGRLSDLEGNLLHNAQQILMRKKWENAFNERKRASLSLMEQYIEAKLIYIAQNKAKELYNQLMTFLQIKVAELDSIDQSLQKTAVSLGENIKRNLEPQTIAEGTFELKREVLSDKQYFLDFYREKSASLLSSAVLTEFIEGLQFRSLDEIIHWMESQFSEELVGKAMGEFAEAIDGTSLMDAIGERYPDNATEQLGLMMDDLLAYCSPFWQFERDTGRFDQEGKSIIGIQSKNNALIPERFRQNRNFNLVSTGFKHSIDVVRVKHGVPAFLLKDMDEYKVMYELVRQQTKDPLHILPDMVDCEDIFPDEHKKSRQLFALGLVFEFIIQIGSFYYLDLNREYSGPHKIKPTAEFRLEQGRSKAEETLIHKIDFRKELERKIEDLVQDMGNKSAIDLIENAITELKVRISNLPSNNEEMRPQLRREVTYLQDYQRMLGAVVEEY